jgi:hypothetical protein
MTIYELGKKVLREMLEGNTTCVSSRADSPNYSLHFVTGKKIIAGQMGTVTY